MPALPPVPSCLRVDLGWNVQSDANALTRLHFTYTGSSPSGANCATLATNVATALATNCQALFNGNVSLTSVTVTDLASSTGAQGVWSGSTAGTRSGHNFSNGVAVILNYGIARRYRGGKPRSYLPFLVAEDLASTNVWGSTAVAAVNSGWQGFITAVKALSAGATTLSQFVNVSYYSGFLNVPYGSPTKYRRVPQLRSGGPVVDTITSETINSRPGSQRRRNLHSR